MTNSTTRGWLGNPFRNIYMYFVYMFLSLSTEIHDVQQEFPEFVRGQC